MANPHDPSPIPAADRVAHYMIRVSQRGADAQAISGLVELLGSGEKERFETAAELLRLLTAWPGEIA